ncbi:MAG TPA: 4-carboxy-4-hydroxy-2-oxoadipate aldolase/oxaloacetate decarboxylase [Rhizomicrobium sp.]|jgi:4-hydroxy-4-methyl-2-oxoglutarate aldolase
MARVIRNIPRPSNLVVQQLAHSGVATVHEAQGRRGLFAEYLRPIWRPAQIAGPAVTCEVHPGDNWAIHVAVEQCRPGDILVVAPTTSSNHGYLGDLLAASLQARGVRGVVIDGGVRDVSALTQMQFPVWSRTIHAAGTVKEIPGNVNCPLACGGMVVLPGDVVVADDDGVCLVRLQEAEDVAILCQEREQREATIRARLAAGELGLDIYDMRARLAERGLSYQDDPPP